MEKHRFSIVVLAFLVFATLTGSGVMNQRQKENIILPVTVAASEQTIIHQYVALSPNGLAKLTLKETLGKDFNLWDFYINDLSVFNRARQKDLIITLPFNSFSPDNKYFFFEENQNNTTHYYLAKASGEHLNNEQEFIGITDIFYASYPDFKLADITGWASNTLLILNTDNLNGSIGPSFWFDVSRMSLTRLSTRFN